MKLKDFFRHSIIHYLLGSKIVARSSKIAGVLITKFTKKPVYIQIETKNTFPWLDCFLKACVIDVIHLMFNLLTLWQVYFILFICWSIFPRKLWKKDRVRGSFEVTLWSQKVSSKENPSLFPCIEHKASKLVLDCIWTVYFNLHKNILTRKVEKIL